MSASDVSLRYLSDAPSHSLIPDAASTIGVRVDVLFYALVGICTAVVVLIFGLVIFYVWHYRASADVERTDPHISERKELLIEAAWSAPVIVIFIVLFIWGADLYARQYGPLKDQVTIDVVGKQWMWKIEHPDGVREINELHVPTGERIRIRLTSEDVIHSFSVPAFRLKRDAVPQRYTTFSFVATEPGTYQMYCTEYCGTDHAHMRGRVVVMKPDAYAHWLDGQDISDTPAAEGKRMFTSFGCAGCHASGSSVHAPDLAGIYGKQVHLADGRTVKVDHAYIHDSILHPKKDVVAGYRPIMPSFEGQLDEEDILQLVAYIQSLGDGKGKDGS